MTSRTRSQEANLANVELAAEKLVDKESTSRSVVFNFPWWIHPLWPALLFVSLIVASGFMVDSDSYSLWKVPRYVSSDLTLTAAISGLAFAIGLAVTTSTSSRNKSLQCVLSPTIIARCGRIATITFALTLVGYFFWIAFAIGRGASVEDFAAIIRLEEGSVGRLKRLSPPVAGLTTITQLGPVCIAMRVFLRRVGLREKNYQIYTVIAFALFRSFFYGERLAIIEVIIPVVVVFSVVSAEEKSRTRSRLVSFLAPLLAVPVLWSVFAIFEYSRSWLYYRNVVDSSFFEYISTRLLGYYVTTINNSSLYHSILSGRAHDPFFTFPVLWEAPGLPSVLGGGMVDGIGARIWWSNTLVNYANPEFNNEGTFLISDADLGTMGSVVYWLIIGVFIGFLYSSLRRGNIAGLIAYSVSFIGLLEIVRITYWVQGRYFPMVIAMLFIVYALNRPNDLRPTDRTIIR